MIFTKNAHFSMALMYGDNHYLTHYPTLLQPYSLGSETKT
jgi:hypothetical protein